MAITLGLTPFVVHRIGLTAFGFWAIISALTLYAGLLDFGIGASLMRYVAHFDASAEHERSRRVLATGFWALTSLAAFIVAVDFIVVSVLPSRPDWPAGWKVAVIGVGISFALDTVSSVFLAIPSGLGRWDLQAGVSIATRIAYAIVMVVTLEQGMGLVGLALAAVVASALSMLLSAAVARSLFPLALSPRMADRRELGELARYSINIWIANATAVVNTQTDKLILVAFAPLSWIGLYEIGSRVAFSLRSLPILAFGPMVAAAARDTATQGKEHLRLFYERTYAWVLTLAVAPLLALYGAAYPLVLAWLGPGFKDSAVIASLLGVGYAVNIATGAGTSLARGCGRPQLDRNYSLVGLVLNVVLTAILGVLIGGWGVVIATVIALVASSLWFLRTMDTWLDVRYLSFSALRNMAGAPLLGGAVAGVLAVVVELAITSDSRVLALVVGAAACGAFGVFWISEVLPKSTSLIRLRGVSQSMTEAP